MTNKTYGAVTRDEEQPNMTTQYTLTVLDGGGSTVVECVSLGDARKAAREWVLKASYPEHENTIWEDVRIEWIDEDGDERTDHVRNIAVDPPEPKCLRGKEHDWQAPYEIVGGLKENPGVWGNGGGLKGVEVCMHCGCGKHWDSWAQRRDNGVHGLDSVSYVPREYVEQIEEFQTEADEVRS